jgi:hypothetical protein
MIAAFLPLPSDPQSEKGKSLHGNPSDEFIAMPAAFKRHVQQVEEMRYQSAKWWRTLNRFMAFIGLLLLGAIAALVVIGVREGWGQRL